MEEKENNNIWILFANGESSRVNLSLHQGKNDRSRPADGYVVTGGGLSRSVRRASEAVYNWLQQSGRNPDHFVAGFDVQGADSSMVGESGGLSFAIALAARLMNKKQLSVAATGEIVGGHFPGPLAAIDAINDKFSGAMVRLHAGSMLLYPAVNDADIAPALRSRLEAKNIRLCPVSSVAEALERVFGPASQPLPASGPVVPSSLPGKRSLRLVVVVAVFCIAAGILWNQGEKKAAVHEKQEEIAIPLPSTFETAPEKSTESAVSPESRPPNNRGFE